MNQQLKTFMMPLAMIAGLVLYRLFAWLNFLTPYLIFLMLFITFCRVDPHRMRLRPLHGWLLAFQLIVSAALYLLIRPLDEVFAQGMMICVLTPVAMAAVVIAGMLGANLATMATYSLLCNVVMAVATPVCFSFVGTHVDMPFGDSFALIFARVGPMLILPFVAAQGCRRFWHGASDWIAAHSMISFYMWLGALAIVSGRTMEFILRQNAADYTRYVWMALASLLLCLVQFGVGRRIGRRYGDTVAGGQSLGQKNTVLAIWMSQTYLDPIASIAPAAYVLWQNLVNSFQIWKKGRVAARGHEIASTE